MQETTKQLITAHVALKRSLAIARKNGKSVHRIIRPIMFALTVVEDITEYSLLGESKHA